ncbi:MAG: 4'-phosphopantetheinyl transferase superfamily protein [Mangrovibacterium sp.]
MPLYKTIEIENGRLFFWEISETEEEMRHLFPDAAADPAFLRLNGSRRKMEWFAVRALLLSAGCHSNHLCYLDSGEPCIEHPEFTQISISHSDRFAGLFLHRSARIGLDIENRHRNFIRVEKKYLSEEEIRLAHSLPDGHGYFWCIKEAVYKAAGIPGLHFSRQIRISLTPGEAMLLHKEVVRFKTVCTAWEDQLVVWVISETKHP